MHTKYAVGYTSASSLHGLTASSDLQIQTISEDKETAHCQLQIHLPLCIAASVQKQHDFIRQNLVFLPEAPVVSLDSFEGSY